LPDQQFLEIAGSAILTSTARIMPDQFLSFFLFTFSTLLLLIFLPLVFHITYDFFLQGSEKIAMGMGFFVWDPSDSLSSIKGVGISSPNKCQINKDPKHVGVPC
jgi:hypothetical protein